MWLFMEESTLSCHCFYLKMSDWDSGDVLSSEDESDFVFEPVVADKNIKRNYQVDFISYTTKDLERLQEKEINQVSLILGCAPATSRILLQFFKWNQEKLIESFMENEESVVKKAGVVMTHQQPTITFENNFFCFICCETKDIEAFGLVCGHKSCINCYRYYLKMKIAEEGESISIKCPGNCPLIVNDVAVKDIVDGITLQKSFIINLDIIIY